MSDAPIEPSEHAWRGEYQPPFQDTKSEAGQVARVLGVEIRGTVDDALEAIEEVKTDDRFTDTHRSKQAREIAVQAVHEVRESVDGELDDLEEQVERERAEIRENTVQPREPTDSAGQLMDSEIRAVLREMKSDERARYLLREAPADVLEAALRAPPVLTGLDPSVHEDLMERAINTRYASEVEDLEQAERNIAAVRKARDNAYKFLTDAGGGAALHAHGASGEGEEAA